MRKTKEQKINFTQLVSEARVARIIEEEEQLEKESPELLGLKAKTCQLLQEMEIAREQGDEERRRELRNEIVVDNLRLVTQVLKKYGYFSPDKFQNGCIGLLKAAETYDSSKDVPFHNYAAFCIETEIRQAFRRVNRVFESRNKGFLESLDAPAVLGNGDTIDKHEIIEDPFAEQELDAVIEEAGVQTLFYDIIIPCIRQYGTRAKDIDMELWQKLEIQYFVELSMEQSQRQRLTFTEMAKQLGTTPQNIRVRHKKVMELIRKACEAHGYRVYRTASGRARFVHEEVDHTTKRKKGKNYNRYA